ncbi:PREDICTED: tigger transposable element-derived protein 1-like [Trachymyrmex cornetzi]|uniref:tigger transposable element-derived protein 1-like n=1 Tax=Trachymyrmex cornetzi TaxID=471704 RepID=UPI00084F7E10|nr:PREDICTED: tigger transposable element-derived protein 1-like [Trachymyrmex cornetzi]
MGKIRKRWSDTELEKALADVRCGKSINGISKSSGIPKSTLIAKLKGYRPIGKRSGPPTVFSIEEEAIIVHWMLHLSQRGFPVTKTQLFYNVVHLIKRLGRETPFTDGRPGRHWYEAFLRRHPEISIRVTQNLSKNRASVTEDILRGWFKEVEQHLTEKQLINIDGARIFNCDESAFYLCPKGERVLVKKGDKAVYNFTQNDEKECLTVLFMTNAMGTLVPPMIIFPYERIPYSISQSVPISWGIGKSENGWMTAETFYEYICNIFEPWLTTQNIKKPVILYVDGRSSHMTLPLAEFCSSHEIELIALFPNATHLIQPLDVALFRTLKSKWRDCVNDWRMQNQRNLRRGDFGSILKIAIEHVKLPSVMSNGFRKCGLFPFSADALQYNQLLQKKKHDTIITVPEQNVENNLLFIESNIDKDLLGKFRCANETGIYNDNLENLGLFLFWQKIVKLSSNNFYNF